MNPAELPLRDIHLPAPVGWWPLAPGWWALLLLILLTSLVIIFFWQKRRRSIKRLARRELQQINNTIQPPREKLVALSGWLRRVSMSLAGRNAVASLSGEAWLRFLDQRLPQQPFSQGPGRALIEQAYRNAEPEDLDALFSLCLQWLEAQQDNHRTARQGGEI